MLLTCMVFVLHALLSEGHITRMPCAWHAKFLATSGKRSLETPLKIVENLDAREKCSLRCLANENCTVANYADTGTCELIEHANDDDEIEANGWQLLKTDTTDNKNIGPICETMKPCPDDNVCRDSCSDDNKNIHYCMESNVAKSAEVAYPADSSDYYPTTNCIDGIRNNLCMTSTLSPAWISFRLFITVKISRFVVYDRTDCCPGRLGEVELRTSVVDSDFEDYEVLAYLSATISVQEFPCNKMVKFFVLYNEAALPLGVMEVEAYV